MSSENELVILSDSSSEEESKADMDLSSAYEDDGDSGSDSGSGSGSGSGSLHAASASVNHNKRKMHTRTTRTRTCTTRSQKRRESVIVLDNYSDDDDDDDDDDNNSVVLGLKIQTECNDMDIDDGGGSGRDSSSGDAKRAKKDGDAYHRSITPTSSTLDDNTGVEVEVERKISSTDIASGLTSSGSRSISTSSGISRNKNSRPRSTRTVHVPKKNTSPVPVPVPVPVPAQHVVTQQECDAYMNLLKKNVQKRTFPLSDVPNHEVISTGRTIKPLKGWTGHWPALREFLQNTVDHLSLLDEKTDRRRACIDIQVNKQNEREGGGEITTIAFMCQDVTICKFVVSTHELMIEQWYTYPIPSRALDTGVVDSTKSSSSSSNSAQAGGFGDGFKTAATALIANSTKGSGGKGKNKTKTSDFESLTWSFYAIPEQTKVTWSFEGQTKDQVATFAKCQVLQVVVDKSNISNSSGKNDNDNDEWISEVQARAQAQRSRQQDNNYVMRQSIKVKNIGKSFLEKAVPQFAVFWDLDDQTLISTIVPSRGGRGRGRGKGVGGDFLGPALQQPRLFRGELGNIRPQSGVYVRGIWVRTSKIKDALMCFYGNRLEVTGRDRNDVDEDELLNAVSYVLTHCNDMERLGELLSPLRHAGPTKRGAEKTNSWLLKPASYFNRVIEKQREFILHDVLKFPKGSIFISNKQNNNKTPFFSWASNFLRKHGTPLIPIEKGANKYLFEEVDEYQLTEKCVQFLRTNAKNKKKASNDRKAVIRKFLNYLGMEGINVVPSEDVVVVFSHGHSLYIPESMLNRDRIIMVINVCHSTYEGAAEKYSSLVQALVETLPARKDYECSVTDAKHVEKQAKRVNREVSDFLHCQNDKEVENVDDDIVEVVENRETVKRKGKMNEEQEPQQDVSSRARDIDKDIEIAVDRNKIKGSGEGSRAIEGGSFALDNAGNDHCIRPSSDLTDIPVDRLLGGGSMLFDRDTAVTVKNKSFSRATSDKILLLRNALNDACVIIQHSIPSTKELLTTICVAYDGKNDGYEAFCDGTRIVVNLFAYLPKAQGIKSPSRSLIHDLVITVTHEMAHLLKPDAGHGPVWRDTHMKMIIPVMNHLHSM